MLAPLFSGLGCPVVNFCDQCSVSGTHQFLQVAVFIVGFRHSPSLFYIRSVTVSGSYVFILIFVVRIELDRKRMTDKKLSMEHISEKINAGTRI
jgi:hypothetical protein